ncbi:hypothetical protein M409DRAFT_19527 [Zasmidium cellare ATCC 36951]|uniref:Tat pathway signal sequence n=1 Tax=Zasmidium cellare ATCC 36951 TaxID=1080233 RepID=A0A6A6CVH4_ZASCE|nr:uncharacterized protein M409DRAFT_19527 [Zasmidium cellare ATCC 36951]KAF2170713.1 hypothetical protein M409DRAFT_19527 [Zasmidium cellare ATCC 36951]
MDFDKHERDHESTEALLDAVERRRDRPWQRGSLGVWSISAFCNVVLFLLSLGMLMASLRPKSTINTQDALRVTSIYTPVFEDTAIRLQTTHLNGSLYQGSSVWHDLPSDPVAEEAWDQFEHIRTTSLTSAQLLAMGKEPSTVAKYEDKIWHMGDDAYVGTLDFFHQVHCLNMLRKAAFAGNAAMPSWPVVETIHLQHCTGMLMQHLLCTADAGMVTYQWRENSHIPYPDFGVNRQCRDWRQLVAWRDEHAVDLDKYMVYKKPGWVKNVPWSSEEETEFLRELDRIIEEERRKSGG